jgi:hypothetical protein
MNSKLMNPKLVIAALVCLVSAGSAQAGTVFTYTGNTITLTLDTSDVFVNMPLTTVTGTLTFTMPDPVPSEDTLGFALEQHGYLGSPNIMVGTDSLGHINAWDISQIVFGSYPAFAGEDPFDFYCTYSVSTTTSGDSVGLNADHDAGLCPGTGAPSSGPGTWTGTAAAVATPEPGTYTLLGGGLVTLAAFVVRRNRRGSAN